MEVTYAIEYELDQDGYPTEKGMYQLLKYIRDYMIECNDLQCDLAYTMGYLLGNKLNIDYEELQ